MRRSWKTTPAQKQGSATVKTLFNLANYAEFVNYGHRVVSQGKTVGYVKGKFMLEKAIGHIEKKLVENFRKEVERVNKLHDK